MASNPHFSDRPRILVVGRDNPTEEAPPGTELLRSPAEQQTELVHRHFPLAAFYRLDLELERDVSLDDVASLPELRAAGDRLADAVDWDALLDGRDQRFRVTDATTLTREYCRIVPD